MPLNRKVLIASLTVLAALGPLNGVGTAGAGTVPWKGAETFLPIVVAPNLARCGPFPRNLEAKFVGSGVDTNGGPFAVVASGCLDTETVVLSEMSAVDTYLRTGESVNIAPADAALSFDPATCVAASIAPVPFTVAGGTGRYAVASGSGTYEVVFTMPNCVGPQQSVHIWFEGTLDPTA